METGEKGKPHLFLREQRLSRGWSLQHVVDELHALCAEEKRVPGVTADMVSKWEHRKKKPSPFYQEKLCRLYGLSAIQLGFVDGPQFSKLEEINHAQPVCSLLDETRDTQQTDPNMYTVLQEEYIRELTKTHQSLDLFGTATEGSPGGQSGAWLALGTSDLVHLFEEGWTLEEVFTAIQVLQNAVQTVSKFTRRQLFEQTAFALMRSIPIPTRKHISVGERTELHRALGECIEGGWKLFVNASMPQVLAVGQAQLQLLHQAYAEIYPSVRPLFYSPVYRLIGAALFFQSRYLEALQAHSQAYLTALEAGDAWNMAESLSWQAGVFKACGRYAESIQTTEAALRLLHDSQEAHAVASRARMLAHWAESAALLGECSVMEAKLSASAELLTQFEGNDEFDAAIWHLYRGTCALYAGNPESAEQSLEHALRELRPNHLHERASAALLQAQASLKMGELKKSLSIVRTSVPLVLAATSSLMDGGLVDLLEQLLKALPKDDEVKDLLEEVRQHPRLHLIHTRHHIPRYLEATL